MKAALLILLSVFQLVRADDVSHDEACAVDEPQPAASSSALLQIQASQQAPPCHSRPQTDCHGDCAWVGEECEQRKASEGANDFSRFRFVQDAKNVLLQTDRDHMDDKRHCSYELVADQDGSRPCAHLKGKKYKSGKVASLDESGYQDTAKLCCHHEMSLFVRREIARQGLDVCDLSDLHGFVHWYDCTNDKKTYADMKLEIAGVMKTACPWLGHLPNCPKKDPVHCGRIATTCTGGLLSLHGASAPLTQAGYEGVAARCCHTEMEPFVRRAIAKMGYFVCDEGSFKGFLHWFDCTNDDQTYEKLKEGLVIARSGLPPMCPWLGSVGKACPPKGHNCPVVEVPEPAAHRRRTACR